MHRAGETVETNALWRAFIFNRWLLTREGHWKFVTKNSIDFCGPADAPGSKGEYRQAMIYAGLICLNGPVGMDLDMQIKAIIRYLTFALRPLRWLRQAGALLSRLIHVRLARVALVALIFAASIGWAVTPKTRAELKFCSGDVSVGQRDRLNASSHCWIFHQQIIHETSPMVVPSWLLIDSAPNDSWNYFGAAALPQFVESIGLVNRVNFYFLNLVGENGAFNTLAIWRELGGHPITNFHLGCQHVYHGEIGHDGTACANLLGWHLSRNPNLDSERKHGQARRGLA